MRAGSITLRFNYASRALTEATDCTHNMLSSKPSLTHMSDNPDRNIKNENFCLQLNIYFKRHMAFRKTDESLVCSEKK
jgi:hypothetical protein